MKCPEDEEEDVVVDELDEDVDVVLVELVELVELVLDEEVELVLDEAGHPLLPDDELEDGL